MSGISLFSKPPELTPEQIKELRQTRVSFQDYLTKLQTDTTTDVQNKRVTPEGAKKIFNQIKLSQVWLASNPNANLNEVLAKRDEITAETRRILQVDMALGFIYNGIIASPLVIEKALNKKIIDSDKQAKLTALLKDTNTWYTKNKDSLVPVDLQTKGQEIVNTFITIVPDKNAQSFLVSELQPLIFQSTSEARDRIAKEQASINKNKAATVDVSDGVNVIIATCIQTFTGLFVAAILLMCGSFAANFAIGRVPAYRVLYFIWGALPPFAPLVLVYAIYKRLHDGRLPIYAILPLSIEPATTRFGRYLWYPFYWVPDAQAKSAYTAFQSSLVETMSG
jgi:hypothetical protein